MFCDTFFYSLFVTITVAGYWFCPGRFRLWLLLFAELLLFFIILPKQTLFIFLLASFVFILGEIIARHKLYKKAALVLGLTGVLSILCFFKYGNLLIDTISQAAALFGYHPTIQLPSFALPLGISYFTFRFAHYLIDVSRKQIITRSYPRFLMYAFFFPIMASGPIERYQNVDRQISSDKSFSWDDFSTGFSRIIWGLFKKIVLADGISAACSFSDPNSGTLAYWGAMYAYTFRIYWDFSGYSDIAIGTARLFGVKVMENFNNPYFQTNISKFWKCWHMSLTGWFRDYLFIPLGGSRGNFRLIVRNTLIVMAATGIWHGAAWHFMFWGLYHAVGLITLRIYNMTLGQAIPDYIKNSRYVYVLNMLVTFHFVSIGWIFFDVEFVHAVHIIKTMFGL